MSQQSVLSRVTIGYSPVIDRQRNVVATRLTLFPERPQAEIDGASLVDALLTAFPEGPIHSLKLPGGAAVSVLVNPAGEALLMGLLAAPRPARLMLEVPAFMAADASRCEAIAAAAAGAPLALAGTLRAPLPAALGKAFSLSIGDEDQGSAGLPRLRTGIESAAALDAALARQAVAVAGWPFGETPQRSSGKSGVAPELQVVMELINRVDREEPAERMEAVLRNDPTLAFRLLRYINSPAFGLSVEISSFRHALMILGYSGLKRWLALLLASASKDASMKPVMHAAVRRGLFMEELARSSGDAEMRGEMFICGVFSLLDRLLRQPFDELLRSVPVPERVQQALVAREGPFAPYLSLVQAVESCNAVDIRDAAAALMLGSTEVNTALVAALVAAAQLE